MTTSSGDGWGFGNSDWASVDAGPSSSAETGQSKQEMLQKRREERRLKQQAAREKRAVGAALNTGGLGAVKKS